MKNPPTIPIQPHLSPPTTYTLHTTSLFDSHLKKFLPDTSLTISTTTGLITAVFERNKEISSYLALSPQDIDLSGLFITPGFVDAHAHVFLHPYTEASSTTQIRDESPTERIIRATNHTRSALLAGYTTYRDLGTEGLAAADLAVRNSISRGLLPGPRLFVATDPISSTGTYEARTENPNTHPPNLTDAADGVDACRRAVRRRLGLGADVIKVYADYRRRTMRYPPGALFPPTGAGNLNPSIPAYTQEEMNALADEAKRGLAPIAAHAQTNEAATMAAIAGFTSVEHLPIVSQSTLEAMKENGTIFVPTLAVFASFPSADWDIEEVLASTKKAWEMGIQLACGGDTGAYPGGHSAGALEMELMIRAGIPVEEVLAACTHGGFLACGGDLCGRKFGYLNVGYAADIVGLAADPRTSSGALRGDSVRLVIKDGRVWKKDGVGIGMW